MSQPQIDVQSILDTLNNIAADISNTFNVSGVDWDKILSAINSKSKDDASKDTSKMFSEYYQAKQSASSTYSGVRQYVSNVTRKYIYEKKPTLPAEVFIPEELKEPIFSTLVSILTSIFHLQDGIQAQTDELNIYRLAIASRYLSDAFDSLAQYVLGYKLPAEEEAQGGGEVAQ